MTPECTGEPLTVTTNSLNSGAVVGTSGSRAGAGRQPSPIPLYFPVAGSRSPAAGNWQSAGASGSHGLVARQLHGPEVGTHQEVDMWQMRASEGGKHVSFATLDQQHLGPVGSRLHRRWHQVTPSPTALPAAPPRGEGSAPVLEAGGQLGVVAHQHAPHAVVGDPHVPSVAKLPLERVPCPSELPPRHSHPSSRSGLARRAWRKHRFDGGLLHPRPLMRCMGRPAIRASRYRGFSLQNVQSSVR